MQESLYNTKDTHFLSPSLRFSICKRFALIHSFENCLMQKAAFQNKAADGKTQLFWNLGKAELSALGKRGDRTGPGTCLSTAHSLDLTALSGPSVSFFHLCICTQPARTIPETESSHYSSYSNLHFSDCPFQSMKQRIYHTQLIS